jgi:hypothetical protein
MFMDSSSAFSCIHPGSSRTRRTKDPKYDSTVFIVSANMFVLGASRLVGCLSLQSQCNNDSHTFLVIFDFVSSSTAAHSSHPLVNTMMQHSINSESTHQDQGPCRSPVPLTPQSSWSALSECPAPPARGAGDFFGMETSNKSSNIYLPMLPSILISSEEKDAPNLRPRLSHIYAKDTQD